MSFLPANLQQALNEQREFRLSDYLSKAWELVTKRTFGMFIAATIVFFFIYLIISFIPLLNLAAGLVASILTAGFFIMAHRTYRNEQVEMSHFFDGFQKAGPIIITVLMQTFIFLLLAAPLIYFGIEGLGGFELFGIEDSAEQAKFIEENMNPVYLGLAALCYIPLMLVAIFYQYSVLFTVFYDISGFSALEASRLFTTKYFWWLILFNFVLSFIVFFGIVFTCGLGLLVALPYMHCAQYVVFAAITGLNDSTEGKNDDISQHFVVQ